MKKDIDSTSKLVKPVDSTVNQSNTGSDNATTPKTVVGAIALVKGKKSKKKRQTFHPSPKLPPMIFRQLKKISNILIKEMMKLRPQWIFKCVLYKILRFSRIYHCAIMLFLTITMPKIISQPATKLAPIAL